MKPKNGDMPAMPTEDITVIGGMDIPSLGMTKRELVAKDILVAFLSAPAGKFKHATVDEAINAAFTSADSFFYHAEKANG